MNVLIVEDEMMAQANLARALTQHFPDVRIVGTTGSVRETVLWLRTPGNSADVIFMDVELSDGDCFEIFRQADVTARVIMTTAYDNYAVRAFEVNSIDYLLKPIDLAALRRAVERCRVRSGGIDPDVLLNAIRSPREYKQRYVVRFNDRIVPVQTTDIAYFYSEEKNTYLVTNDNNRYIMDQSLDVLSDELDPGRFFRISRSCIIAMPAIVSIVKYLGNRLKITARPRAEFDMGVSRSRVDDFLKWLEGNGLALVATGRSSAPPLRFRVLSSGLPGYRSCGGRGLRFRRERGVPQRSSSGIFRRGLKVHFEGSCCGRSSGGVLRGLRLRDPRKGFPWKVSAGAPGRMARRHDKRGAPEIPGRPLFLRPGSALPQSARQRRPLQAIMSCSDSLKVSLCSSSSSGRCIR